MNYKEPPEASQIEVTLIGPGFGESVLIHLGKNYWIIVDSCIDNKKGKSPAAISYLESLGIDPGIAVKLIVATHWHDDHIRGLSEIVKKCPAADFCCSIAFTKEEFINFLAVQNNNNAIASGSGAKELFNVFNLRKGKRGNKKAVANRCLMNFNSVEEDYKCEVWSLSPSDEEIDVSLQSLTDQFPNILRPKKRAVSTKPNNASVVLLVKVNETSILLGGDMENISGNRGWAAILESEDKPQEKASVFKVPHHGSQNAHNDEVWKSMLTRSPFAILSTYNRTPLPTENDRDRICELTNDAYITSNMRPKVAPKRSSMVEKMIKETGTKITLSEPPTGIIQLRKKAGDGWGINLINRACHLSKVYS